MNKQELFDLLFQQFTLINDNRDDLIAKAQTADQADQILHAWRQANLNQMTMGNKILVANTEALDSLASETQAATKEVDAELSNLQNIAGTIENINAVIKTITTAVSLGTSIVGMI